MKKAGIILWVLAGLFLLTAVAALGYGILFRDSGMKESGLKLVNAGEYYGKEGVETGLPYQAEASCQVAGYGVSFICDGDMETYWEGTGEMPQTVRLRLEERKALDKLVLLLKTSEEWGKRIQAFSIETEDADGNAVELVPNQEYVFDYAEGNRVEINLPENTEVDNLTLVFTKNDSAGGGQIAEAVLYGKEEA